MFTTVKEDKFRQIARLLVEENMAPAWFANIEYVNWQGETKNLEFVPDSVVSDIVLVDDFEIYVQPGQEAQWLQIRYFDFPYADDDRGWRRLWKSWKSWPFPDCFLTTPYNPSWQYFNG